MVKVTSDTEMGIFDGRLLAQNGWYVLHSDLPAGKTGKVISWTINPHAIPNWVREPNIGFSQVVYLPSQPKVAVIELDRNYPSTPQATLYRISNDGTESIALTANVTIWGKYFKYNYVKFDFSSVTEPGVYYIKYGDTKSGNFIIDNSVYDKITDATTDVWVPIHMNHMTVNEGYRIWHGEPFKEGYLQAPESDHFDLHSQGPTTDTKYKPYELIPGLNIGGFFDAGDFDIETGSNISVVQNFVRTWELFRSDRDVTFVSQKQRYVDLHRPDGVPDLLQFIEHGTLNLVAQAEQIEHMAQTLSNSVLDNYHHLGDAASITDGLHYDPSLKPYEVSEDGKRSGTPDDMWAFTTRNPMLDFRAATMFAAASNALKGYNDALAERALTQSKRLMAEAEELMKTWSGVEEKIREGFDNGTVLYHQDPVSQMIADYESRGITKAFEAEMLPDDLQRQLREAGERTVRLRNGGNIVIDRCEAMTVIDVNSGSARDSGGIASAYLETNLAACETIAAQIRLRNLGGIILIDFIDMESDEDRNRVETKLKESLAADRRKTVVHGWTKLGIMEMTRKRTGTTWERPQSP